MQNRGTARKRIVPIEGERAAHARRDSDTPAAPPSARVGSVAGSQGAGAAAPRPRRRGAAQGRVADRRRRRRSPCASPPGPRSTSRRQPPRRRHERATARALPLGRHRRCPSMRATTTRSGACRKTDDRALFEKLVLEGFQSGLSWLTILRKRDNFRSAFDGFDPERIARYGAKDIARLMADAGIVRNRLKIEATIDNARALLKLQRAHLAGGLPLGLSSTAARRSTRTARSRPCRPQTPASKAISKALKAEGFRFVGPTTIYAFMQSTGMVNDHLVSCHRHEACAKLQRTFKLPPRARAHGMTRQGDSRRRRPARHARLAAHAVRPPPRPARSLAGRHRDRGHRPRPGPRRPLERPDGRRARLLGRPARAGGRGDRGRACSPTRAALAAGRAAARCARIRDRRPDQPVQGGARPRLQGLRAKLLEAIHRRFGLPPPLPERVANAIKAADRVAAYYEATRSPASHWTKATAISACRAACRRRWRPTWRRLRPKPIASAQKPEFLAALSGTVAGIACQKLGEAEGQRCARPTRSPMANGSVVTSARSAPCPHTVSAPRPRTSSPCCRTRSWWRRRARHCCRAASAPAHARHCRADSGLRRSPATSTSSEIIAFARAWGGQGADGGALLGRHQPLHGRRLTPPCARSTPEAPEAHRRAPAPSLAHRLPEPSDDPARRSRRSADRDAWWRPSKRIGRGVVAGEAVPFALPRISRCGADFASHRLKLVAGKLPRLPSQSSATLRNLPRG